MDDQHAWRRPDQTEAVIMSNADIALLISGISLAVSLAGFIWSTFKEFIYVYEGRRGRMSYVLLIWMGMVTPPADVPGYRDLKSCEEAGGQAAARSNFSFLCIPGPDTANLPGGRQ